MRCVVAAVLLCSCSFEHGALEPARDARDDARPGDGPVDGPPPEGIPPEGLPVWNDIVVEAEAFTAETNLNGFDWTSTTTVAGYSGNSYMQIPGNGTTCSAATISTGCSVLEYSFSITTAGTYHVHARMYAVSSADNSVWWGIDDVVETSAFQPAGDSTWHWVSSAGISIAAGSHTLGIWHREAGSRVDVVAVTQTATPPP